MHSQPLAKRFIGLTLAPGVIPKNAIVFYFACLFSIMVATFIPQGQPFLLTEFLNIPQSEHGKTSGFINFWAEVIIILTTMVAGPLSDKIGRKAVTSAGFFLMALGTFLYPYAESVIHLTIFRCVYAFGIAATSCMIVTIVADYFEDEHRGKATGMLGVMNGLGAMTTVFLLLRLPSYFQSQGMTAIEAGHASYTLVAVLTLLMGIATLLWLKKHDRDQVQVHESLKHQIKEGLAAASDLGIRLAYSASFLARGNLMIVGTFFTLWVTNYGTTELGLSRAEALVKAGMVVGVAQTFALFGAPLFGILADKIDRVKALAIAALISAIGYSSTFFITDPLSTEMFICAIFIGLGEIGCIITSGVLIAQQSPEKIRGATIGMFTMFGAVGILFASVAGGYYFDAWRPAAPFVIFGVIAMAIFIWACLIANKVKPLETNESVAALS